MLRVIVAVAVLIPSYGWTCSCSDYLSFAKGVLGRPNSEAVVVLVENTQALHHGVKVKVNEVLLGTLDKAEINIWGDPGHLCRGSFISGVGRKWIAAVTKLKDPSQGEAAGDFETMSCMATSLKLDSESVEGSIVGSSETKMGLNEFKGMLKSPKDYLEPHVVCQVHTSFRNYDDHVDFYNKVEKDVVFTNGSGTVSLEFTAKSEEDKDFKGRVEGTVTRDFPDQVFSSAKIKGQVTVQDLISPMNLDQSLNGPINIYSRFVSGKHAENTLSCNSEAKLK